MSKLAQLVSLFPEADYPRRPCIETVMKISEIDKAVEGRREELQLLLKSLEDKNRDSWSLGNEASWQNFVGSHYAAVPHHDGEKFIDLDELIAEHRKRFAMVAEIFSDDEVTFQDGKVKTVHRALHKSRKFDHKHVPDLTRLRVISPTLDCLERSKSKLTEQMKLAQISSSNCYWNGHKLSYPTPFRGVVTAWCGMDSEPKTNYLATEVQFITERVSAPMELNHPFDVTQVLNYPDEDAKDYVTCLLLKASILDFQEKFGG